MGIGIAAHCADQGLDVLLLDLPGQAEKGIERLKTIRPPALDDPAHAARIRPGTFDDDMAAAGKCDWIVEAVLEDLRIKHALYEKLEAVRADGALVTSNTSGIPLRELVKGMPLRFRLDFAITHFFNPVKLMKLVELVPGEDTAEDTLDRVAAVCGGTLGKGVVRAKDTVNFIGNRIGCFWMLAGLHKAEAALKAGVSMETIDAAMGPPMGFPATGLYGLIDLIGLDVMEMIGHNLALNLPPGDPGKASASFPAAVAAMRARGQLGRKSGAGFYRQTTGPDGKRVRETFDLLTETWRPAQPPAPVPGDAAALIFGNEPVCRFAFDLMAETLGYAASLVPQIADDIVAIDRAMRWGFNWKRGPFELIDAIGPNSFASSLEKAGKPIPAMLQVLRKSFAPSFYRGEQYLTRDGDWADMPE